ncbi:MAG TPA: glycerophosphodiester phosphodiesterase, partial [Gemmatimonadales bacterium]
DQALLSVIDGAPAPESCAVHSFDHRIIARLGRLRPSLPRGALSSSYPTDPLAPLEASGADTLWQEWQLIDRPLVEQVHRSGRRIIAWTVNDRAIARRLGDLGVDGLCGNYPERLLSP